MGHGGGLVYYLPVLLVGAFPFAAMALPELGRALFQNPSAQRDMDPLSRLHLLAAVSFLVVLVVFSLAATKQINYILPALALPGPAGRLPDATACRLGRAHGRLAWPVFWVALWVSGGMLVLALAAVPAALPLFWDKILGSIRLTPPSTPCPCRAPMMSLVAPVGRPGCRGGHVPGHLGRRRGTGPRIPWSLGVGAALFLRGGVPGPVPPGRRGASSNRPRNWPRRCGAGPESRPRW